MICKVIYIYCARIVFLYRVPLFLRLPRSVQSTIITLGLFNLPVTGVLRESITVCTVLFEEQIPAELRACSRLHYITKYTNEIDMLLIKKKSPAYILARKLNPALDSYPESDGIYETMHLSTSLCSNTLLF